MINQNYLLSKFEWSPLLQSDLSTQHNEGLNKSSSLYYFQTKATGQFSNTKEMEFSPDESVREVCFYFDKGLKYLSITTDKQEIEWGVRNEDIEPYILNFRIAQDDKQKRLFGPLKFGFSLNGNKFGTLQFVLY